MMALIHLYIYISTQLSHIWLCTEFGTLNIIKNTKIFLVFFFSFFFFIIVHRITMSFLDDTNLQKKEENDNYQ